MSGFRNLGLALFLTALIPTGASAGSTATLYCKVASSLSHKAAVKIRCDGSMSECEKALKRALRQKYNQSDDYSAQNRACKRNLNNAYYPSYIGSDY